MNSAKTILAIAGLVLIFLFYYYGNGYFLLGAIAAFAIGFLLMRGPRSKK
jgi:membrane-bound ClpP family serine protease